MSLSGFDHVTCVTLMLVVFVYPSFVTVLSCIIIVIVIAALTQPLPWKLMVSVCVIGTIGVYLPVGSSIIVGRH